MGKNQEHPVLLNGENQKSKTCICPNLLNFDTGKHYSVKNTNIMRKLALKRKNHVSTSLNVLF